MSVNSKRIARNSIVLYARLLLNMAIALYTSRVLLQTLGVEDYGVFGVVGGISAMLVSLRGSFASAIQRYYNFEIGQGDNLEKMRRLFMTGWLIHVVLALILFVLLELIGLWMINYCLIFPNGRLSSANFVFQCTVINTILITLCIPIEALILARERMNFYAGLSVFDSIVKLLGVLFLNFVCEEKLEIYGVTLVVIQIINLICNYTYARFNFNEFRFCMNIDKEKLLSLSQFASWNFLGNIAFTLGNEVTNFLLNLFGGVVYNASRSIAYQVKSAVISFMANGMIALRPQAVQLYASENKESFFRIIEFASKTLFYISLLMVTPLIVYTTDILQLWLGTVPPYADIFIQLIMLQVLVRSFHEPIDIIFKSSGHLRNYQFASLISTILILPFSFTILKIGYPIYSVFVLMLIMEVIEFIAIFLLAKSEGLVIGQYVKKVLKPCFLVFMLSASICISIYTNTKNCIPFYFGLIINEMIVSVFVYFIGYTKNERINLLRIIK